jgi:hypothetical protein
MRIARDSFFLVGKQVWLALALAVAGCDRGPEIAPVTGRVVVDGKPIQNAEVTFEPAAGRASHGHTDQDGRYELRYDRQTMGALVGSHTVRILSATEVTLPNGKFVLRPQTVPPRYNTQSELRKDVVSGETNVFDFELRSGKK